MAVQQSSSWDATSLAQHLAQDSAQHNWQRCCGRSRTIPKKLAVSAGLVVAQCGAPPGVDACRILALLSSYHSVLLIALCTCAGALGLAECMNPTAAQSCCSS